MLRGFIDFLAKMGLAVRDDPPKVIDFAKRDWGEVREGLVLSAEVIRDTDPFSLSIVMRNVGSEPWKFTVPGWLHFYSVRVRDANGGEVAMAPYGRAALDPSRRTEPVEVNLQPSGWTETLIPLGSFFSLQGRSGLSAQVEGTLPSGATIASNAAMV